MMLTIVLLSLFLLSITFFSGVALRKSVQERVESLTTFVTSVEADLPRQLFISGFRIVFLVEKEIIDTGTYPSQGVYDIFQEAFFNGTIGGDAQSLLVGSTFSDLESLLQDRANRISADVQLSNPEINVTQEDPWNVKVTFTTDFFVEDKSELASWNKTLVVESYISIQNFTDPLYSVSTSGERNPNILITPYTSFGLSEVNDHITNGYYKAHVGAPSFIDRLEGNIVVPLDPGNGIESLVNVADIPDAYLQGSRSVVDYIYFSNLGHSTCAVSGTPSWFLIDTPEHETAYGVTCS